MVATLLLSRGFDYLSICTVFHIQVPFDLFEWVQQAGRAGCDGQHATSVMLLPEGKLKAPNPKPDNTFSGVQELYSGLQDSSTCLRVIQSKYLSNTQMPCPALGPSVSFCICCASQFRPNANKFLTP